MMSERFPAAEFDAWAKNYDLSVQNNQQFPFVGYDQALDAVVQLADAKAGQSVLDLGTGTGLLALRFANLGCSIWATDFSPAMLTQARTRLPQAQLLQHDLNTPWPATLNRRFDRIVSSYVFHHFPDQQKQNLIVFLVQQHLEPNGKLIIADISFPDRAGWQAAQQQAADDWDEELYWTASEMLPALHALGLIARYRQISYCAGVYEMMEQSA
jgi:putative AdoMet-dependent methyltransferase